MNQYGPVNYNVDVPREVIYRILIRLSVPDIDNFCKTSTAVAHICQDEEFWKLKVTTDYPDIQEPIKNWKYTAHVLQPKTLIVKEYVEVTDGDTGEESVIDNEIKLHLDPNLTYGKLSNQIYKNIEFEPNLQNYLYKLGNTWYMNKSRAYDVVLVHYEESASINHQRYKMDTPLYQIWVDHKNFYASLNEIKLVEDVW